MLSADDGNYWKLDTEFFLHFPGLSKSPWFQAGPPNEVALFQQLLSAVVPDQNCSVHMRPHCGAEFEYVEFYFNHLQSPSIIFNVFSHLQRRSIIACFEMCSGWVAFRFQPWDPRWCSCSRPTCAAFQGNPRRKNTIAIFSKIIASMDRREHLQETMAFDTFLNIKYGFSMFFPCFFLHVALQTTPGEQQNNSLPFFLTSVVDFDLQVLPGSPNS